MRIHIATDHAGLEFSQDLAEHLGLEGHEVVDHGPLEYDPLDDYPSFCIRAAKAVVSDENAGVDSLGVVFGGSGNGEQMAANKVTGARAALVWSVNTAVLAREHNNANSKQPARLLVSRPRTRPCPRATVFTALPTFSVSYFSTMRSRRPLRRGVFVKELL